jgi:leucyl aminopeptidase
MEVALFLSEFVGSTPWVHIDMAGPMDSDGDNGWLNRGATAYGARLMIDFCANFTKPGRKNK